MLFQLMYASRSVHPRGDLTDIEILKSATRNNPMKQITGALVRDNRRFMQIMEGAKGDVLNLLEIIEKDPRHFDLNVLTTREVETRSFGQWAMAYGTIAPGAFDRFTKLRFADQLTLEAALAELSPQISQPAL